jgi:hypothetical protein
MFKALLNGVRLQIFRQSAGHLMVESYKEMAVNYEIFFAGA